MEVVSRAMRVWGVVDAVDWPCAVATVSATFRGWEVEFLGKALGMLTREQRTRVVADNGAPNP